MVDGCFWHACPVHATWPKANAAWWREKILGNVKRDRDTDARLTAAGWLVLRFWEHEETEEAAKAVYRIVNDARRTSTADEFVPNRRRDRRRMLENRELDGRLRR